MSPIQVQKYIVFHNGAAVNTIAIPSKKTTHCRGGANRRQRDSNNNEADEAHGIDDEGEPVRAMLLEEIVNAVAEEDGRIRKHRAKQAQRTAKTAMSRRIAGKIGKSRLEQQIYRQVNVIQNLQ